MDHEVSKTARERLMELAEDPAYRRFILGYLVAALDERYWPLLVDVALDHVESLEALQKADRAALGQLSAERWS